MSAPPSLGCLVPGDGGFRPLFNESMEVRNSPGKGRGVFALRDIPKHTVLDVCPVLIFPQDEYAAYGRHTRLDHYTYRWRGGFALALGLGSIFNHAPSPNCGWVRNMDAETITYCTIKDVVAGSELFISYGVDASKLWFDTSSGGGDDDGASSDSDASSVSTDDPDFLSRVQLKLGDEDG